MNRYIHYLFAPLFYLSVSLIGGYYTRRGIEAGWYATILKPAFTPPGPVIGVVWTIIYALAALSLIMFVNKAIGRRGFLPFLSCYLLNGILNAAWSFLFFGLHLMGAAVVDAVLIALTVAIVMAGAWQHSRVASLVLLPYLLWSAFASYLNYAVYRLNMPL